MRSILACSLLLGLAVPASAQAVQPQHFPSYMDFQGRFLAVLSDADMVASAYNGPPIGPRTAAMTDMLTLFPLAGGMPGSAVSIPVGNAATAWPSLLDFTPDGRTAYVAETELPATPDAQSRADLVPSPWLRVVSLDADLSGAIVQEIDTESRVIAVSVRPQGDVLVALTTGTDVPRVGVFAIGEDGRLGPMRSLPLDEAEGEAADIKWNPAGDILAVTMPGSDRIRFYVWDGERLAPHGNSVGGGKLPGVGHWSPDGRHFFVTHLHWGGDIENVYYGSEVSTLAAIRIAPRDAAEPRHVIVSKVATGAAAEEFAVSPDGRSIVTLNMERSYAMPGDDDLTFYSSLSLVAWNPERERLHTIGTTPFEGILPEGITFDASGNFLAVANFAHFNPRRPVERTTVDIWRLVEPDGPRPMLVQTDIKLPVMRGAHVAKLVD